MSPHPNTERANIFNAGYERGRADAQAEIERLRAENEAVHDENGKLANTIGAENLLLRAANAELLAALRNITSIDEYLVDGKDCTATLMRKFAHAALTGGKE